MTNCTVALLRWADLKLNGCVEIFAAAGLCNKRISDCCELRPEITVIDYDHKLRS